MHDLMGVPAGMQHTPVVCQNSSLPCGCLRACSWLPSSDLLTRCLTLCLIRADAGKAAGPNTPTGGKEAALPCQWQGLPVCAAGEPCGFHPSRFLRAFDPWKHIVHSVRACADMILIFVQMDGTGLLKGVA